MCMPIGRVGLFRMFKISHLVNPLTFNDENNVTLLFIIALPFTVTSFKFEKPLTFKNEYMVKLSDVILFASNKGP